MKWSIPRGYYIARAWLTAASYGGLETISGYSDYEMAEAHHDLEGTESYGERRYGGTRGGWFDETKNARLHPDTEPEKVRTYVDGRVVDEDCNATEPRTWEAAESLWEDGFPPPRDYTSHTYTTPNKTLESYETIPAVPAAAGQHNQWGMCVDRVDITAQLSSRVGPDVEVTMTTAHAGRGNPTREPGTINAGRQAYDRGTYRFKSRATLFLHLVRTTRLVLHTPLCFCMRRSRSNRSPVFAFDLRRTCSLAHFSHCAMLRWLRWQAPENSLKPYLGPAYGTTHVRVGPDCLTSSVLEESEAEFFSTEYGVANENTTLSCVFGQQTDWQGGYGGITGGQEDLSPEIVNSGVRVDAEVLEDGTVTCISPDMSEKKDWQQLIVFRDVNGTGDAFERVSHALGFYLYPHAPRNQDVRHHEVEGDLKRWQRSSVFSHRQGPALEVDTPGNQFEGRNRRRQRCPDPTDTDC